MVTLAKVHDGINLQTNNPTNASSVLFKNLLGKARLIKFNEEFLKPIISYFINNEC